MNALSRLDLGGSCEAAEVQGARLRDGVEMVAQIPLQIPVTDFIVLDKLLPTCGLKLLGWRLGYWLYEVLMPALST